MIQASTEHGRTDVDSRPDSIQKSEENENIKTTIEELEDVELFIQWLERKVYIGDNLSHEMKGRPPGLMTRKSNEDPSYPPIKQKKRKQGSFKNLVIQDKILRKFNMKLNPEKCVFGVSSGLELAHKLGIEQIIIKSDSQLVVNQMLGTYTAREARMRQYLEKARDLIKRITSTPYHSVGNGQAESTNTVIINNLKKRLEESKGNWPEVLPSILWAYHTTTKTSTGETPFSLVYRAEALIPVEIGEPSTRYIQANEESNEEEMRINLDLLEERREAAFIRLAAQNQVME
uniref:Uncharacterized protein LOC104240088 n=1 Tax=Nicotiana sylvestris TaxID=4096 RepID=A0A1U7XU42_NICSY|nr:PREDICTED: uncharacterized protein LOC104240088 [Nicotiana sylvestris]